MRFGQVYRLMRSGAVAAAGTVFAVMMNTAAQAACTPAATNAPTPAPGTIVTCTGTTADQNAGSGYGTGNQTGITINVVDGASVTSVNAFGIYIKDATITNGVGSTILGGAYGIGANSGSVTVTNSGNITGTNSVGAFATNDLTMTNRASGVILGGSFGLATDAGSIVVDNAGSITGTGIAAIQAQLNATVTNRAGGVISSSARGIASGSGYITVDNAGSITAGTAGGIEAQQGAVTVTNRAGGTISGARGVAALLGTASVQNAGTISGSLDMGIAGVGGATVVNAASGQISGEVNGIIATGTADVTNAGFIAGITGSGVAVANSAITNLSGGIIAGRQLGVTISGGAGTITNSGTISGASTFANSAGIAATEALQLVNNAGATISGARYGVFASINSGGSSIYNAGNISGGDLAIRLDTGGNTLTLAPGSVISGNVQAAGNDTLQLGGTGAASFDVSQIGAAAQYQGFGAFNKIGTSVWTLTGTATYAGPVNVNAGTLAVNGNLASASQLTVNADGTIGGSGTLGATAINGGTLAPGNSIGTLTMSSLTMTAASTYLVEVSGAASDKTVITGSAAIAGKVSVNPLTRLGATTTYTILNAGTLTGTFGSASVINNFARNARLSYVGNNVLLTLDPGLLSPILPGMASVNQKNVAAGIDNALVSGATLPASFNALFALSGNDLLNGLTQVSGETATGSQQTTFDAMTQFMGLMSDPFTAGRGSAAPGASSFAAENDALAYTPDGRKRSRAEREAFAMFTKAPPRVYEARWNVWAAGFGGSRTTDGNAVIGSGRTTSSIAGGAVGADYWFSPETVAGFAMAGGGTSFSVAGGGSGRSDLFQAGAFVRHTIGASYITATAAYGWQDISTDRLITAVGTERLRASFNANAYSGRIEGGHRWLVPELGGIGVTPYAALQVTAFDLPAYAETSLNGAGGFALNYAAKTATATRTELGLRSDKSWALAEGLLTLRGRAAWAHDYNADRNVTATFQSLPGSSFVVNGASAGRNAALTSASAEWSWMNGWSVAGTFEGEFSDATRSYAGKGVVRYAW